MFINQFRRCFATDSKIIICSALKNRIGSLKGACYSYNSFSFIEKTFGLILQIANEPTSYMERKF